MTYTFILVGKIKEDFYTKAIEMYLKRLTKFAKVDFINLNESKLSTLDSEAEISRGLDEEAKTILSKVEKGSSIVLFDTKGKTYDSVEFSKLITDSPITKSHMYFIVGGSNGISDLLRKEADARIKISDFTFTHALAMVIATESVYRAMMIASGSSYHK